MNLKKKNLIKKNLIDIFCKVFSLKNKKINNFTYTKIINWDSLNHIILIKNIEKKFKIQIKDTEIIDMISFKNIYTMILKKKK